MIVTFAYNLEYDKCCWERLIEAGSLFGKTFPKKIEITREQIDRAMQTVETFQGWWNQKPECEDGLDKIYGHKPPETMMVYINTSGYSMDDTFRGWISLSMMRDTPTKVRTTVIHELGHMLFRLYWAQICRSMGFTQRGFEEVKEIITSIHNDEFDGLEDRGYEVHKFQREKAREIWRQTRDLKKVLEGCVS